jgi:hypothetical protein
MRHVLRALALCLLGLTACAEAHGSDKGDPFAIVWDVMQSPRCQNCHTAGTSPFIGESREPHPFSIKRGKTGRGLEGMRCTGCHERENAAGKQTPPGAPDWRMPRAATKLAFTKRSDTCKRLAPRITRALEVLKDPLHQWPWSPGEGRPSPSEPRESFIFALTKWRDAGAHCR